MRPDRKQAFEILEEAAGRNPGPWREHSIVAAECAQRIAGQIPGMDGEKAYVMGLLHDIGRRFGHGHMAHIMHGYEYMMELGFDEAARICLTHSFCLKALDTYIGNRDIPEEKIQEMDRLLAETAYDDYDRLIQLCDAIALPGGPVDIAARMTDVKKRYGGYPQEKWDKSIALKHYFEEKMGMDLYEAAGCFYRGELVELGCLTRERCHEFWQGYEPDPDMYAYSYSWEKTERYFEEICLAADRRFFAILKEGRVIGETQFKDIDFGQGTGTLEMQLQTEGQKNQGLGTEAERLMLEYGAGMLCLNTVFASAPLQNICSQHVLEELGFAPLREENGMQYYQLRLQGLR